MPTNPASQPDPQSGSPELEPLTRAQKIVALLMAAILVALLTLLIVTGHGAAALIIGASLAIAGIALVIGEHQ